MLEDDVQLIRRILSGDDLAFSTLVERYQKGVHALIWRKVGDFHHAEELTQDVFLQVYKKLGTLKEPQCFAGWLYVIANRLSLNWIQRQKPTMQSLENTPVEEIEESSYIHYVTEEREAETAERRSEVVKHLLEKLPESERTVVTLHYLGEMTTREISKFLGVSVNTIKSRLRRGRERLQEAELLVSEVLGSVQLPADLTARIMRQVADMSPTAPPAGKPLVPWAAFGTAVVLVVLMLGVSHQYVVHFQKPYSFEALSEPTVEIVDAPIVLDILSKPSLRRQFGQASVPGKSSGAGTQISETTLRSNVPADLFETSTAEWTRGNAPPGGHVRDIFSTSKGTLFVNSLTGIYRLATDDNVWANVNAKVPIIESVMPMAENRGTLYIVSTDKIFASVDDGETWNVLCARPKGDAVELIVTDKIHGRDPQTGVTLYIALRDKGVFRSTDGGTRWDALKNELRVERISDMAAVEGTVFIGTNSGLYRLDSDVWKRLSVATSEAVYSLTVYKKRLYVATGPDLFGLESSEGRRMMERERKTILGRIFLSSDFGESWTEITPKDIYKGALLPSGIKVLAAGEVLLALGANGFRSTDGGETWTDLGRDPKLYMLSNYPSVAVDERTFYKTGVFGVHRTTDGGDTWHPFIDGMIGTWIGDLIVFNDALYVYTQNDLYQSTNNGMSWERIEIDAKIGEPEVRLEPVEDNPSGPNFSLHSKWVVDGSNLYLLSPTGSGLRIYRLSTNNNNMLIPVRDVPGFDYESVSLKPTESARLSEVMSSFLDRYAKAGTAAVSKGVFYVEYKRRLFKWKFGTPAWKNTKLVDTGVHYDSRIKDGFKLAAAGDKVYVGKRDGRLFHSINGGDSWRDVTPNIPLRFTAFKDIVFRGSTVYIATDAGILASETGEYWSTITDGLDTGSVIDRFAVAGRKIYGIDDVGGVYRLEVNGQWEKVSEAVLDGIISFGVTNNKLYSVAENIGIFHISLTEK